MSKTSSDNNCPPPPPPPATSLWGSTMPGTKADYILPKPLSIPKKSQYQDNNTVMESPVSPFTATSQVNGRASGLPSPPSSPGVVHTENQSTKALHSASSSADATLPASPQSVSSTASSPFGPQQYYSYTYNSPPPRVFHPRTNSMPVSASPSKLCSMNPHVSNKLLDEQRRFSDNIHDRPSCSRHHHRRSSVAIKFKPTYLLTERQLREPRDIQEFSSAALAEHVRRPPTPMAERILKGDFSY